MAQDGQSQHSPLSLMATDPHLIRHHVGQQLYSLYSAAALLYCTCRWKWRSHAVLRVLNDSFIAVYGEVVP